MCKEDKKDNKKKEVILEITKISKHESNIELEEVPDEL